MIDFFVVFCLGVCMGIVIQGFRDKNAFKGHYWRLNHTRKNLHDAIVECNRLDRHIAKIEKELWESNHGSEGHG